MSKGIRILVLEDLSSDVELLVMELNKAGIEFEYKRADNKEEFIETIINYKPNLIISDYSLPQYDGISAIKDLRQIMPDIPIIIVTGSLDEETAAQTIKEGAWDYVVKERLYRLPPAVIQAMKRKEELDDRKKIEKALQDAETEYESLRKNVPLALFRSTVNGNLLYANPALPDMFGFSSIEEALRENLNSRYSDPEDRKNLMQELNRKGTVENFVVKFQKTDGSYFWAALFVRAVFDNKGNHIYQDGIIQDITEFKQANDELIAAKDRAEQADKLKTAFLANMSHEIRTPMNAIIGFSDLLMDQSITREELIDYILHIQSNGEALLKIINDILDVSQIEAGALSIEKREFDINEWLRGIFSVTNQDMAYSESKGVKLLLDIPDDDKKLILNSDKNRLKQVMSNLLTNAIKFTEKGNVTFGYTIERNHLRFFVSDTGMGIPKEMQDVIFDVFRQVDNGHTREFGGTGLGLTIAKSIAEKLGGRMWVESELYKGSKFFFTIPHVQAEEKLPDKSRKKAAAKAAEVDWSDKIILIAEDVDSNFVYLNTILKRTNAKVIRALDGVEAVEICNSNQDIDVVLMDIQMPNKNGYEATREIKQFRKELPIIGQTAFALSSDRKKVLEAGCDDYLVKPILKRVLFDTLEKFFS